MNRQDVLDKLREHEADLRARGVAHAALFGSLARGESRPDSDIDILVEFEPEADVSVFDYVALQNYISGLFTVPVDVVDRDALKPFVRPPAESDALYAF